MFWDRGRWLNESLGALIGPRLGLGCLWEPVVDCLFRELGAAFWGWVGMGRVALLAYLSWEQLGCCEGICGGGGRGVAGFAGDGFRPGRWGGCGGILGGGWFDRLRVGTSSLG